MLDRRRVRPVVNAVLVILGVFALAATSESETVDYKALPGDVIDLEAGQAARLELLSGVHDSDEGFGSGATIIRLDRLNNSFDEDLAPLMVRFPGSATGGEWAPAAASQSCSCFGETSVEFRLGDDFSGPLFSFRWDAEVAVDFGTTPPLDSGLTLTLLNQELPEQNFRILRGSVPADSIIVNRISLSTPEADRGATRLHVTPTGISVLLASSSGVESLEPLDMREFLGSSDCETYPCSTSLVQIVASSGPYGSGPEFDPAFHDGTWRLISNDAAATISVEPITMETDVAQARPALVPWPDEDYATLNWTVTVSVGHDPAFDTIPPIIQLRANPIDPTQQRNVAVFHNVSANRGALTYGSPSEAVITMVMQRDGDRWRQEFSWAFHAGSEEHEINRVVTASVYRDQASSSGTALDITIDVDG